MLTLIFKPGQDPRVISYGEDITSSVKAIELTAGRKCSLEMLLPGGLGSVTIARSYVIGCLHTEGK